jgi:hypothetical protein
MQIAKKLMVEDPNYEYDVIVEEKNLDEPKKWFINGPQMQHTIFNKNGRAYLKESMEKEVARYIAEEIAEKRAFGELEHSSSASVSLQNVADRLLSLESEGNVYTGKSLVMDTPNGKILQSILQSGGRPGRSSRALGTLLESSKGKLVDNLTLVAIDTVCNPSNAGFFVQGILESKEFICTSNGRYEENFDRFEKSISKLPSKYDRDAVNKFLLEHVRSMMKSW